MSQVIYLLILGLMVLAGAIVLGILTYTEYRDHNVATGTIALLLTLSMAAAGIGILVNSHQQSSKPKPQATSKTVISDTTWQTDYTLGSNMTTTVLPSSSRSVTRY